MENKSLSFILINLYSTEKKKERVIFIQDHIISWRQQKNEHVLWPSLSSMTDYYLLWILGSECKSAVINYSFQACVDEHESFISITEKHPMRYEQSIILSSSRAQYLFSGRISWNNHSFENESLLYMIERNSNWQQSIEVAIIPLCCRYCLAGMYNCWDRQHFERVSNSSALSLLSMSGLYQL